MCLCYLEVWCNSYCVSCLLLLTWIGLKVLYKIFPEGMLTGSVPKTCYPSPPPSARKSSKTASLKSPPPTATPSAPHKEEFTPEGKECSSITCDYMFTIDLDSIQTRLDEALLSNDGKELIQYCYVTLCVYSIRRIIFKGNKQIIDSC